jgi:monofunctional biosynthetic peptidoglycan transglycosylase
VRKLAQILIAAATLAFGFLSYVYLTLPDVAKLASANPATTAFMELRADEARDRQAEPRRVQRWVSYARISGSLKRAVLVAEDDAFWQHDGIDVKQIKESFERDLQKGTFSRGGSTITQQLAKNLYLSPSKNPVRKLRELLIARRLEASLSKTRIFEIYLNVIEWGDGIYGADAASRAYFRKPASALTADEAALLAACIINPRIMNPAHETPGLLRRQRLILGRMGIVTPPPDPPAAADDAAAANDQARPENTEGATPARAEPPEKPIR